MTTLGRRLAAAGGLWLMAVCSAMASPPAAPAAGVAAGVAPAEILVLLRLPPRHFRPGADYGDAYGDASGEAARHRIAARLAGRHGLTLVTDWPLPAIGLDCFVMAAPASLSPEEAAARVAHEPDVAWAEPMHAYRAQGARPAAPDDPLYPAQPAAVAWRLADLHQMSTGAGVRVAVVDSQVEADHPDLKGQVQVSRDFVEGHPAAGGERHGTGVAGVIAARAGNGVGIAGVAPGARLMALRACWQAPMSGSVAGETTCDSLSLAKAIHFALSHDAQVINLSLSGPPDRLIGLLLDEALRRGLTVVAACDRRSRDCGFPASHAGVVAAADQALGSPRAGVYLAPGRDVPTTQPEGRWYLVSGDSYAAAHVSGLAALLEQHGGPRRRSLVLVSRPPGGGVIDACASLIRTLGPCDCACRRQLAAATAAGR